MNTKIYKKVCQRVRIVKNEDQYQVEVKLRDMLLPIPSEEEISQLMENNKGMKRKVAIEQLRECWKLLVQSTSLKKALQKKHFQVLIILGELGYRPDLLYKRKKRG